ncbi:MAG: hypothetical protein WBJ10_15435 [Daejeonella sp.]|uniref:hypothetical protein n=1 Tax=Daejeonella sp. TaxID=2805397 RepID=UPI003C72E22C
MTRLDKLISERSKAFHRITSLYVELSMMTGDSPRNAAHLSEIAELKLHVTKLQRKIVLSRTKKAEKYLAEI